MSVFLDFDGTITAKDTVGDLATFALRFQEAERGADLKPEWDAVVKAYVDDHKSHVDGYHLRSEARRVPHQEISFLRDLKTVETRSLGRINRCKLFEGISPGRFRRAGRELVANGTVSVRPGFRAFVDSMVRGGWSVYVVSVNWSSAFIEGACDHPDIRVVANDVLEDGSVVGPGVLNQQDGEEARNLTNSKDKLEVMQAIIREEGEKSSRKSSVYFGDSTTDLECLLAADRGVVVSDGEDSTLLQTLRRIGKGVPRVCDGAKRDALTWASDFDEVTKGIEFDLS